MPDQEIVKLELELPKDQIHILDDSAMPELASQAVDSEDPDKQMRIAKFKKRLAEARQSGPVDPNRNPNPSSPSASRGIIAKASLQRLPTTTDTSPPNVNQKRLIALGLIITLVGLILWPLANFVVAIAIAAVGAAAIATGTFVKV
jgi:hypothetical protein